jgi:hypothetical protein
MITYAKYVAIVRTWDRNSLLRGAGWASAQNRGRVIVNGHASPWLPWNIAGMAVTAHCRGTPHGPTPDPEELRAVVALFSNIDDGPIGDEDAALHALERVIYEQMPYQRLSRYEWSRAQALFVDTPFPSDHLAEVMRDGWVEELLGGVSIAEYTATGFVMLASALASNGVFSVAAWDPSLGEVHTILPRSRVEEIAQAHFVTTVEDVKAQRRRVRSLNRISEKYAFNPLVDRPFVSDVLSGAWIAPSTDLAEQKMGVAGITYLGIDRWGTKFTRDLGRLFEAYVGRNLRLVRGATVLGEISFGSRRKPNVSSDWILVTGSLVVLVEVKAASPTESIRQSAGELFDGVRAKLSSAIGQLNKTAEAVGAEREAFAEVPIDLPIVGLVVTLGNFSSASLAYRMGELGKSNIPLAFVSIGELEVLATLSADQIATTLLSGFADSDVPDLIENFSGALSGSPVQRNPIIDAAWLASPLMQYLKGRTSGDILST